MRALYSFLRWGESILSIGLSITAACATAIATCAQSVPSAARSAPAQLGAAKEVPRQTPSPRLTPEQTPELRLTGIVTSRGQQWAFFVMRERGQAEFVQWRLALGQTVGDVELLRVNGTRGIVEMKYKGVPLEVSFSKAISLSPPPPFGPTFFSPPQAAKPL